MGSRKKRFSAVVKKKKKKKSKFEKEKCCVLLPFHLHPIFLSRLPFPLPTPRQTDVKSPCCLVLSQTCSCLSSHPAQTVTLPTAWHCHNEHCWRPGPPGVLPRTTWHSIYRSGVTGHQCYHFQRKVAKSPKRLCPLLFLSALLYLWGVCSKSGSTSDCISALNQARPLTVSAT